MKPKNVGNKFAWLGYLGIVGILGLFFANLTLLVFLLFFFFFSFANVPADELFTQHVHKAGLRALVVYLTLTTISFFLQAANAVKYQLTMDHFTNPTPEFVAQLAFCLSLSNIVFMITVCVFIFTLMYFIRKEKKGLDIPEVDAHAENQA